MNSSEYTNKMSEIKQYAKDNFVPILQDKSLELIETILEIKKPESILEIILANLDLEKMRKKQK